MSDDITALLSDARRRDRRAADQVFELLYADLRRLARARLRQNQPLTLLDTTGLVHESYLKLVGVEGMVLQDRRHFMAYASRVMRSVIVDVARARQAERRGGARWSMSSWTPRWPTAPRPRTATCCRCTKPSTAGWRWRRAGRLRGWTCWRPHCAPPSRTWTPGSRLRWPR